jgi:trans-aconitate methyltransferase
MTRTPPAYFDRMYAGSEDPWGFETRWYERRKYDVTLASLPRGRYRAGYEPGCSIGVLSEGLARRCQRLLASDQQATAVAAARRRLAGQAHVTVERHTIPEDWPEGPWDLVVLSEVAYYFDATELRVLLQRAVASLEAGGHLVAVHYRGGTDYPLTGDVAHQRIDRTPELRSLVLHAEDDFLLGVWEKDGR